MSAVVVTFECEVDLSKVGLPMRPYYKERIESMMLLTVTPMLEGVIKEYINRFIPTEKISIKVTQTKAEVKSMNIKVGDTI